VSAPDKDQRERSEIEELHSELYSSRYAKFVVRVVAIGSKFFVILVIVGIVAYVLGYPGVTFKSMSYLEWAALIVMTIIALLPLKYDPSLWLMSRHRRKRTTKQ